jgi:serine/threonine protein kinase
MDNLVDKTLGRYRILSEIDKGGMGKVYLAEHIFTHKKVALKTLLMGWVSDLNELQRNEIEVRFRREAQAAAQIAHENVVEIYDFDLAKDNIPAYIAMEFIAGESLEKRLKRAGKFSFKQALPLMIQITDGIAEVHQKGFVHRDLKPANIMIISSVDDLKKERVKIVDFGLAKVFNSDLTQITKHGQTLGTPSHTPPEQWESNSEIEIDERADVYALGLIFYEMLSGTMPFQSNSPQGWFVCHTYDQPKPMANDVPEQIAGLIMQSLEKKREQRPKSAVDLKNRLIKIKEQIQKQEKEKEDQLIADIKNKLKSNLALIENYKIVFAAKDQRINELTDENIKLQEEITRLNRLSEKGVWIEMYATSHIGRVLKSNTDNYLLLNISGAKAWMSLQAPEEFVIESQRFEVDESGIVLAVSDGMGGALAGEVASQMAVETVGKKFLDEDEERTIGPENSNDSLIVTLYEATLYANHLIHQRGRSDPQYQQIGASFTGIGITNETVDLIQVGMSRAYLVRDGNIYQITKDQSLVQQLIDANQLSREEAEEHALKKVILQALGAQSEIFPVTARLMPHRDDILLLCSDGLSDKVSGTDMKEIVLENLEHLEMACAELVKKANENGGEDNITVILAKITSDKLPEASESEVRLELLNIGNIHDTADEDTAEII